MKCYYCGEPAVDEYVDPWGKTFHMCPLHMRMHNRYKKDWKNVSDYDYYETYGMRGGFDYGSD